jgi:two-component system phosphate regulon sensor histidine kinase PhoR
MSSTQAMAVLIRSNLHHLLSEWRNKACRLPGAAKLDTPTLNNHIPVLLEELAMAFEAGSDQEITERMAQGSSATHGLQRLENGFAIEEVVAEYNMLRHCLHEMADQHGIPLIGQPVKILNAVLDAAIAAAINAYAVQQALGVQRRREEYLAFVAHDLRTPLNAVALAAQLLKKELENSDKEECASGVLKTLERNVGYLTTQINRVLQENVSLETESGVRLERRQLDLWPLVEALIHDLNPVAGSGSTKLINEVPHDMMVCADAALLRRVFQNLIANAIRHTPSGEIKVSARRILTQKLVECEVSDTGSGIVADRLPHIFNKFETDGKRSTDFGLGLTICKTFVEAHGGSIAVSSQCGQGASFYFTLPDSSI